MNANCWLKEVLMNKYCLIILLAYFLSGCAGIVGGDLAGVEKYPDRTPH